MNDNHQEPTLEESIQQVMRTLPPVVHDYVVQEKYTIVAKSLMAKYNLRIDQGGVLERELALLLMGIEDPTEFTQALADEAKLDQKTISAIAQDVNEQIFVPLREAEEQGGMKEAPQSARPVVSSQPASHFTLENKIPAPVRPQLPQRLLPPHVAPLPPKAAMPRAARSGGTLGDVVRSILPPPAPVESRTLLEDHEEPHIEINKLAAPAPLPPPAPVRPTAVFGEGAPANLPGAMTGAASFPQGMTRDIPVPPPAPAPAPRPSMQPVPPKPAAPAPVTSYAADPYREPIDEPLNEM